MIWNKTITYANINKIDHEKFKSDLTIKLENKVGNKIFPPDIIKLYSYLKKGENTYIIIPRFYKKEPEEIKPISLPEYDSKFITKNQRLIFSYLASHFSKPAGAVLIMKTGEGKTWMSKYLLEYLKERALIVVHNEEILKTWTHVLKNPDFLGKNRNSEKIGRWYGKEKIKEKITVGLIKSLIKLPKEWFKDFDIVIFDEITEFLSEKNRTIFELSATNKVLALTATPECRKQKIFELHCGQYIIARDLKGYEENEVKWNIEVFKIKYKGSEEYTKQILSSIGYTSVVEMDKQFISDPERKKIALKGIEELAKDNFTFVFASQIEALLELKKELKNAGIMTGKIKDYNEDSRIILTTYKFASKGISMPKFTAIYLYTPIISAIEQTLGRILRTGGGWEKKRTVIDLIDWNTSLKTQFYKRKKIYDKLNCFIRLKNPEDF